MDCVKHEESEGLLTWRDIVGASVTISNCMMSNRRITVHTRKDASESALVRRLEVEKVSKDS